MVRHESAEALGAIEDRWTEVETILKAFCQVDDIVVAESCMVALDAADYWGYGGSSHVDEDWNESDSNPLSGSLETTDSIIFSSSFSQQKAF